MGWVGHRDCLFFFAALSLSLSFPFLFFCDPDSGNRSEWWGEGGGGGHISSPNAGEEGGGGIGKRGFQKRRGGGERGPFPLAPFLPLRKRRGKRRDFIIAFSPFFALELRSGSSIKGEGELGGVGFFFCNLLFLRTAFLLTLCKDMEGEMGDTCARREGKRVSCLCAVHGAAAAAAAALQREKRPSS